MKKHKYQEQIDATLNWCNDQRAIKGKRPIVRLPKGGRSNPNSCPCGKATGLWVGNVKYGSKPGDVGHYLPDLVAAFTVLFDQGEFPEYEL